MISRTVMEYLEVDEEGAEGGKWGMGKRKGVITDINTPHPDKTETNKENFAGTESGMEYILVRINNHRITSGKMISSKSVHN